MRIPCTDRKNVTNFLHLILRLACKVTCYFRLFSLVLVSVLRTSINVLSKSKSKNYVTWIANLTKLFLSVFTIFFLLLKCFCNLKEKRPGCRFSFWGTNKVLTLFLDLLVKSQDGISNHFLYFCDLNSLCIRFCILIDILLSY